MWPPGLRILGWTSKNFMSFLEVWAWKPPCSLLADSLPRPGVLHFLHWEAQAPALQRLCGAFWDCFAGRQAGTSCHLGADAFHLYSDPSSLSDHTFWPYVLITHSPNSYSFFSWPGFMKGQQSFFSWLLRFLTHHLKPGRYSLVDNDQQQNLQDFFLLIHSFSTCSPGPSCPVLSYFSQP